MKIRSRPFAKIAIFCLSIYFCQNAAAGDWKVKNRIQLGVEEDSNIFESKNNPISAESLRLLFQTLVTRGERKRYLLHLGYESGLQIYRNYSVENKLINEIEAQGEIRLWHSLYLGLEGWGRYKLFLRGRKDYAFGTLSLYLRGPLPNRFSWLLSWQQRGLDYIYSNVYDFSCQGIEIIVTKLLYQGLTVGIGVSAENLIYSLRPVFRYSFPQWMTLAGSQEDRIRQLSGHVQYQRGFLIWVSYIYEGDNSNSYGYSYRKHRAAILVVKPWPRGLLLRLYSSLQKKTYLDALAPIIPLELDTEREMSNFLVVDLSKDFTPGLTAILRLGWYSNESLFRDQYYRKRTIVLALDFRF